MSRYPRTDQHGADLRPRPVEDATAVTVPGVTNPPALVLTGVRQSAVPAGQEPVPGSGVVAPGVDFADFTLE